MSDPRCGTNAGYQAHYTDGTKPCQPCREAHTRRKQRYRKRVYLERGKRRVDSTGTHRRLQALAVMAWSQEEIGKRLGVGKYAVAEVLSRPTVIRETAQKVAAVYDELWDQRGPNERAARMAKARGWLPPLAWNDDEIDLPTARPSRMVESRPMFDDIAIERAMRGSEVHLRPAERAEAVRRLTDKGFSAAEIADRLRVTTRSVVRIRAEVHAA